MQIEFSVTVSSIILIIKIRLEKNIEVTMPKILNLLKKYQVYKSDNRKIIKQQKHKYFIKKLTQNTEKLEQVLQ